MSVPSKIRFVPLVVGFGIPNTRETESPAQSCTASEANYVAPITFALPNSRTSDLVHKRKGHPATGRPSLQGRIVPTEARPSKLSAQILGSPYQCVKQFLGLKLLCFQQVTYDSADLRKTAENLRFRPFAPSNSSLFNYLSAPGSWRMCSCRISAFSGRSSTVPGK